jgi:hypothetical protein
MTSSQVPTAVKYFVTSKSLLFLDSRFLRKRKDINSNCTVVMNELVAVARMTYTQLKCSYFLIKKLEY